MAEDLSRFCLIDVGSTTTKVFLFARDNDWSFSRHEEATTVEKPYEDVTFGVANAFKALEKKTGIRLLDKGVPCIPCFSTSSAGGGLAVVVAGLVREVTTKSAERAALGAGSIIQEVIALDDGRTPYTKINVLKKHRPDMVLLAGGFDGGSVSGPVFMAELICQSNLRPKLSTEGKLPVIYAGNVDAREYIDEMLKAQFIYVPIENLRPSNVKENLEPTRNAIHDVFMEHVMSRAPGYEKYTSWISAPILPTPAAVTKLLELVSRDMRAKILAIDIGGATTDVFTADNGKVFRTVSANLGMSYSILNVMKTAGLESIRELINFEIEEQELLNRIGNKYLRPTELPSTTKDTEIECAIASAAIREAVKEHFKVLYGVRLSLRDEELTWNLLRRKKRGKKAKDIKPEVQDYNMIIGSGGKLSHSPRKTATAILLNALDPGNGTNLAVDNVFMFPQLGTLTQSNKDLALELFYKFGLINLGKIIAPKGNTRPDSEVIKISGIEGSNQPIKESLKYGDVKFLEPSNMEKATLGIKTRRLKLKRKQIDYAQDQGPLIIDARGRPSEFNCGYFLSKDYLPAKREFKIAEDQIIFKGEIKINRELAISGEVLVEEGDFVSPDKIIAKSIKTFQRPFFLNIAERIEIEPKKLSSYFHKKVGDEIEKNEILAKHKLDLVRTKTYRSPVSATIEKILPNGIVIAREKPENVRKSFSVQAALELNLKPDKIRPYLKCEVGQEVESGQILAISGKMPYQKKSLSPIRGIVREIDCKDGVIVVEPLLEELELQAWFPGKVERTTDKGCILANKGIVIQGMWGNDKQVWGELAFDQTESGKIMVYESVNSDDLAALDAAGISGLITGGVNLKDIYDLKPGFAIVVTECFGAQKMSPEVKRLLSDHRERLVSIDAHTQLRAGVMRPRIYMPDNLDG